MAASKLFGGALMTLGVLIFIYYTTWVFYMVN